MLSHWIRKLFSLEQRVFICSMFAMHISLVGKMSLKVMQKKKKAIIIVVKKDTIKKYWSNVSSAVQFCTTTEWEAYTFFFFNDSWFTLSWNINRQNCRWWCSKNPPASGPLWEMFLEGAWPVWKLKVAFWTSCVKEIKFKFRGGGWTINSQQKQALWAANLLW